ncbi:MAG: hypothetical protein ACK5H2_04860 [Beutenbergiaceae bacterium]
MQFRTSGALAKVDLSPVLALIPPLWTEWANLKFDRTGGLVNPLTGTVLEMPTLVEGQHRRPGACYRFTVVTQGEEFPAGQPPGTAPPQVVIRSHTVEATLRADTAQALTFALRDPSGTWTGDLTIRRTRLPIIEFSGSTPVEAHLEQDIPAWIVRVFGKTLAGGFRADLGAVEQDLQAVTGTLTMGRSSASLTVDVHPQLEQWSVDTRATLQGRGLARLPLWLFRARIRAAVDQALATFWSQTATRMRDLDVALVELTADIDAAGGPAPFLHRALWDSDFTPMSGPLKR